MGRKAADRKLGYPNGAGILELLEQRQLLSSVTNFPLHPDLRLAPERRHSGGSSGADYYVNQNGYSPSQIQTAYGFNDIDFNGAIGEGAGTTIAIVDAYNDPDIAADLNVFDTAFGLAAPPSLQQVNQNGKSPLSYKANPGWALETSLDVEWAHAIAPEANILLVEARNDNLTNLLSAVNFARNSPGVVSVSMSWGGDEFPKELSYDSYFTTPSGHTGITFVAASGDNGLGAEWPAVSPSVLSVGGTSLYALNSTGAYGLETAWGDSGGGISQFIGEPSYQNTSQQSGGRSTPDIAYNADPNTGYAVYDSIPYQGISGWQVIGGTSAGSPQIAAMIAIADQGRQLNGLTPLDGATQTLPLLYGEYAAYGTSGYNTYATVFHDIISGGSSFFTQAERGYDLVTGLGTPVASEIVTLLTGGTITAASPTSEPLRNLGSHRIFGIFIAAAPVAWQANPRDQFISVAVASETATQSASAASKAKSGHASVAGRILSGSQSLENLLRAATSGLAVVTDDIRSDLGTAFSSAPVQAMAAPRAAVELAQFDASYFADSLRSFAHETAALAVAGAAPKRAAWIRSAATSAAALVADAVLVGYWYSGRIRRRDREALAADVQPPAPSSTPIGK